MTDIGPTAGPYLGATLVAPLGQSVGSFVVSPLTNNVYQTPFGAVDVTGWTAFLRSTWKQPGEYLATSPSLSRWSVVVCESKQNPNPGETVSGGL